MTWCVGRWERCSELMESEEKAKGWVKNHPKFKFTGFTRNTYECTTHHLCHYQLHVSSCPMRRIGLCCLAPQRLQLLVQSFV